jgi:hypothetical protein
MIKLYGVKPSNYYSLAKAILLEKGLAFEEVPNPPSQKAPRVYLAATIFAGRAMCSKEAFRLSTSSQETKSSKTPLPLMTANAG